MERNTWRNSWTGPAYVALAAVALANAGCLAAAAGVAAGGAAAGYAYYKGRVSQDFNASLDDTWAATLTALGELGMPVVSQQRDATSGGIESRTSTNDTVHMSLETHPSAIPAEGTLTRVGVRIGTFGDAPLSERLLNQISAHLVARLAASPQVSASPPGPIQPSSWMAPGSRTNPPPSPPIPPASPVPQTAEPPLASPQPRR
jgi:hypothetical protein